MSASASTVPALFLSRIARSPEDVAYMTPEGKGWRDWTWKAFGERVRNIACGLRALGLQDEQCCAIASGTRLDWIAADLGILCAGGATTTIYPSSTTEDTSYIVSDSGSVFVFAENR